MIHPPRGFWLDRHYQIYNGLKIILIIIFVFNAAAEFHLLAKALRGDNIWINDFFALWSFAKFSIVHPVIDVYINSAIQGFQTSLGGDPQRLAPCFYPPSFLLYIMPLGLMSFYRAFIVWTASTLLLYVVSSIFRQTRQVYSICIIILAPATLIGIITGQTGLLASAVMVGGFRLVSKWPILAGVVFGLASFKPQFGLLIPIALISARQWRAVISAGVTILALIVVSGVAFGWSIWPMWLSKLPGHFDWVAHTNERFQPTILANLSSLGVPLTPAWTIQACIAVLVVIITWICFRQGVTALATAVLLVGTFLATPYAFVYDMPMLTNAVLALPRQSGRTPRFLTATETFTRISVLLLPNIMVSYKLSMIRSLPLIILFGLIVWRILGARMR